MKSFVLVAALGGLAAAQFGGLPTCATNCATKLLGGTGCNNDAKCVCSSNTFIQDVSCCLAAPGGCGADDQKKAIEFANQLCTANGVSVPNVVSCPSLSGNNTTSATPAATSPPAAQGSGTKGAASMPAAAPIGLLGSLVAAVVLL